MRYRLMAAYQGVPYEAGIGPSEDDVVLFAACPPPEELGFEPATGHWRKELRIADVQALWESRPTGIFRGGRCVVLDDLGDRLHIAYLGHDAYHAEQLGYWQVDRGVFELVAPRDEVTDVVEERSDYPHRREGAPAGPTASQPPDPIPGLLPVPGALDPVPAYATAPYHTAPYPILPPAALRPPARSPGRQATGEIALPQRDDPPLPLEAEALRATSAAAALRATSAAARRKPADARRPSPRRADRRRVATQRIFTELADLASIPQAAYAIGEEVDGCMCLLRTSAGFEVFHAVSGSRHEVRLFADEESAYFYLFGVLAAEAVRTGRLVSKP